MKTQNNYRELFNPKSIAIVGASNKKGKIGAILTDNILKLGYQGRLYLINPNYKILKFKRCHKSLSSINASVDLAIVAVPAKFVLDVIMESADKVKNYVIISAGFSETGAKGMALEKELEKLAKKHSLNILGPNCLGFIAPKLKLNASFAGGMPKDGNIAFVSQSGALAVAFMDMAKQQHIGFSNVISVGNKMQLDETELLHFLATDKKTKVIGMYLEGIKNGAKFIEAATKVSRIKPIVILKAGKTEKSQKAISSHTGALAGSDDIMDVAFEKSGVIRAENLEQFFDLLTLISFMDAPRNKKAVVITNAGGAGVLTTDAFKGKEIILEDFSIKFKDELRRVLPSEASVENPIDLLGDAGDDRYENALKLLKKKKVGFIIPILTPQQQTPVEKIADVIISNKKNSDSSLVTVFIGGERIQHAVDRLKSQGIPNFTNPDNAIEALDKYYKWALFKNSKEEGGKGSINTLRKKRVAKIISDAIGQNRKALLFADGAAVMAQYGIVSSEYHNIFPGKKMPQIEKFPVVVKVDSDNVLHKSDKHGVILNVKSVMELEEAVKNIQQNFPGEQVIVQSMLEKKTELILGMKIDDVFGPVIVYGLGGIYTEVFKMVNFLLPPLSLAAIRQHVLDSKIGFLFSGARGQKAYDLEEFVLIIKGLAEFSLENKQVREVDINPLFVYNDLRSANAVDIKIIF